MTATQKFRVRALVALVFVLAILAVAHYAHAAAGPMWPSHVVTHYPKSYTFELVVIGLAMLFMA